LTAYNINYVKDSFMATGKVQYNNRIYNMDWSEVDKGREQREATARYHNCAGDAKFFGWLANALSILMISGAIRVLCVGWDTPTIGFLIGRVISQIFMLFVHFNALKQMREAIIDCI